MCLALSSVVFVAVEVEKWLVRRGYIYVNSATPRRTRSLKKGNTFETGAHLAAEGKEQSVR
jgi:hypothetical protein